MTDPDFYRSDRPRGAQLPEDRPRGGTPGARPAGSFGAFWIGGAIVLVLVVVIIMAAVG